MRSFPALVIGGAMLGAATASVAVGQDPPLRTLLKYDLEYAEPFSCVSGLRELSDGRIIVADQREKLIQIINLRTGAVTKVGREGQGPGEWGVPAGLFAAKGDTTLLWDQGNRRFLTINPDGTTGKSFAATITAGSMTMITVPRGVDRQGGVYIAGSTFTQAPGGGPPVAADSAAILRLDPPTGKIDTLGFLRIPRADIETQNRGEARMVMIMAPNPMLPQATWTVTADGRVAIIHPEPYHLEWLTPSKTKTVGPTIRYQKLPVTQADKDAPSPPNNCLTTISVGGPPGGARGGAVAGAGRTERRPPPREDWPDFKPPFLGGGRMGSTVVAAPNGDIWVLRTRAANDEIPTYDIFDARGQLTGRMALPKGSRFVAFGNGTIYLSRMDEDDLLYVQRYRLDQAK
jgi:hypothetical protein